MCASRSSGAMAFEEISSLAASIFPFGSRESQSPEPVDREDVDVVARAVDVHRRVELHAALGHAGHLGEEPRPLGAHQGLPRIQAVEAGTRGDVVRDRDDGSQDRAAVFRDGAPRLGDGDRPPTPQRPPVEPVLFAA